MISVFIRTYRNDIHWLRYCLAFIKKNLLGYGEIVVCIPSGQQHLLEPLNGLIDKIVVCKTYADDYLGQQASKLQAHNHCSGEYILFVDSDVMFLEKTDIRDYFKDNKPVLLKDKFENVGDAICWKSVNEKLFLETIEYEYMRRAPQLYLKDTLVKFNEHFSDIENYIIKQPRAKFSEFNALGFFIEKHESDRYSIIDLSEEATELPVNPAKQYWSWSGMTQEEKMEIELRLNA